jgi:hypothetical protein
MAEKEHFKCIQGWVSKIRVKSFMDNLLFKFLLKLPIWNTFGSLTNERYTKIRGAPFLGLR